MTDRKRIFKKTVVRSGDHVRAEIYYELAPMEGMNWRQNSPMQIHVTSKNFADGWINDTLWGGHVTEATYARANKWADEVIRLQETFGV